MQTLEKLYDIFYNPNPQHYFKNEVEENHKILIANLSKEHRKVVLRIIDAQMMITNLQSRESFICGFNLAHNLFTELNMYNKGDCNSEEEMQPLYSMEEENEID